MTRFFLANLQCIAICRVQVRLNRHREEETAFIRLMASLLCAIYRRPCIRQVLAYSLRLIGLPFPFILALRADLKKNPTSIAVFSVNVYLITTTSSETVI